MTPIPGLLWRWPDGRIHRLSEYEVRVGTCALPGPNSRPDMRVVSDGSPDPTDPLTRLWLDAQASPADEVGRVARITLDLDATITPAGRWYVATGCSWRRVLIEGTDEAVLMPCVAKDGQPDISGIANLEAACAMRDAAPALARAVLSLRAEIAEARQAARALLDMLDRNEDAVGPNFGEAYHVAYADAVYDAKTTLRAALGKEKP